MQAVRLGQLQDGSQSLVNRMKYVMRWTGATGWGLPGNLGSQALRDKTKTAPAGSPGQPDRTTNMYACT